MDNDYRHDCRPDTVFGRQMTAQEKFARNWTKLHFYAAGQGIKFITTALWRTAAQQKELYLAGKSNCDGYKIISKHQLGRAGDLCILRRGECVWDMCEEYRLLADFWQSLGGVWGGSWQSLKDIYHHEV